MRKINSALRPLYNITRATLTLLLILYCGVAVAQTAHDLLSGGAMSTYGVNPYDTSDDEEDTGEDGEALAEEADSVKQRIVKPLESYFFDDSVRSRLNFAWNVRRDINRVDLQKIDTTLSDWHIDYVYQKDGVGDMSLGGLGQASQPINFFDREQYFDFSFAQPFDAYIYRMENAPFYNVKKPVTQMTYLEAGQKLYREANFELLHAQNISPSTGFALNYKSRGTKGLYQRQDTKNHNLALTFTHTGKRYSVHAGYINNKIQTEENGGVVGIWTVRDSIFEMPNGIPTKLGEAEASNSYRNNSFFLVQSYGVPLEKLTEYDYSMADKTAFYLGHSFEYNSWNKLYQDVKATYTNDLAGMDADGNYVPETGKYYDNWYINPEMSRDSISERVISNRIFVQAQPWDRNGIVGVIDGGIGFDLHTYSHMKLDSYLTGKFDDEKRTSVFAYGSVEGKLRRYLSWGGDVKIYPTGDRSGDYSVGGNLRLSAYIRNKPIILEGKFKNSNTSPSYWEENLFSNHFVFNAPLSKENETRFEAKFSIPDHAFELGVSQVMTSDMIYYDAKKLVAQESSLTSVTSVYLRKKFTLGGLNLDHKILYQTSSNDTAAPVPELSGFLAYYYQFWAVKDVLRLQIGVDGRYTSKYYMPSYNPALSTFYNQREVELGDYPYLDLYVGAKWKRMRILVKYQHMNNNMFGNNEYFTVANYAQNPKMFKMGISWSFYD